MILFNFYIYCDSWNESLKELKTKEFKTHVIKGSFHKETVRSSALQYLEILRNAMLRFVTQPLQDIQPNQKFDIHFYK